MDKVKNYQNLIVNFLKYYYQEYNLGLSRSLDNQIIIDREGNHFQLICIGWDNKDYLTNILFHFDIKNEKIWIQQNNTEELVADYFTERGVPKSDIVLGFQPEYARPYTGFATA
jgi:hypothetical protein